MPYTPRKLPGGANETNVAVAPLTGTPPIERIFAYVGGQSLRNMWKTDDRGQTWQMVPFALLGGAVHPAELGLSAGLFEGDIAVFPSGKIGTMHNPYPVQNGLVGTSDDNGASWAYGILPYVVEGPRVRMSIASSVLPGFPYHFITGLWNQVGWRSVDGLVYLPIPPSNSTITILEEAPPAKPNSVPWARFAQNTWKLVGHTNGGFLAISIRTLLHTVDGLIWKKWNAGITVGFPKGLIWDEDGNLYVVGSNRQEDVGLSFQASTNGGLTFGTRFELETDEMADPAHFWKEGAIGGRGGELHIAYPMGNDLIHAKITNAHTATPTISKNVAHTLPGSRKDFVRIALDSNYRAVIGWGDGGNNANQNSGCYVVFGD